MEISRGIIEKESLASKVKTMDEERIERVARQYATEGFPVSWQSATLQTKRTMLKDLLEGGLTPLGFKLYDGLDQEDFIDRFVEPSDGDVNTENILPTSSAPVPSYKDLAATSGKNIVEEDQKSHNKKSRDSGFFIFYRRTFRARV